jgi:integral membrane sensor domain MASE1
MSLDIPPKISESQAKPIEVEVLPPEPTTASTDHFAEGPPIHALSALILVAVDSLWAIFDWVPPVWVVAIPFCFLAVFVPVFLLQKFLKHDSNGRALAFAMLLGVLAAIPTPITGTPVGLGLLAWTGLGKLLGRPPPKPTR